MNKPTRGHVLYIAVITTLVLSALSVHAGWVYTAGSISKGIRSGTVTSDGGWVINVNHNTMTLDGTIGSATTVGSEVAIDLSTIAAAMPEGVVIKSIANNAFKDKSTIVSVTLPDTLVSIGASAFQSCSNLEMVQPFLPATVTTIGTQAFHCDVKLTGDLDATSVTSFGNHAFGGNAATYTTSITSVKFGPGVTSLPEGIFKNDASLTNVTFVGTPSLTTISQYAFSGCSSLETFEPFLPDTVKTVGQQAFINNQKLKGDLKLLGIESMGSYAFGSGGSGNNLRSLNSVTIGNRITSIPNYCFQHDSALTNVTFVEGCRIQSIGANAFASCGSLVTVTPCLPKSVTTLGGYLFNGSPNIQMPVLDISNVTNLGGDYNFGGGSGTYRISAEVIMKGSLAAIKGNTFNHASVIKKITFVGKTNLGTIGSNAFGGLSMTNVTFEGTAPVTLNTIVTAMANYSHIYGSKHQGWRDLLGLITDKDQIRSTLGSSAATYEADVKSCLGLYTAVSKHYVWVMHKASPLDPKGMQFILQ